VHSNKVARKRLTEFNGTPAMDIGCEEIRKRRYTQTKNRTKHTINCIQVIVISCSNFCSCAYLYISLCIVWGYFKFVYEFMFLVYLVIDHIHWVCYFFQHSSCVWSVTGTIINDFGLHLIVCVENVNLIYCRAAIFFWLGTWLLFF